MRSPASLHEKRAYSPENFSGPVQNDFCNKIGTKLPIRDVRYSLLLRVKRTYTGAS